MKNFTAGSVVKQLFKFSLPIITGHFLQALYIVVDAIWVGKLLGHQALAAISATFPVMFFLISGLIGLSIATNILVGQSYGADRVEKLTKIIVNSFVSIILLSLFVSVVSIIFSYPILNLVNTPLEIRSLAHIYLVIILAGMVIRGAFNWFSGALRGMGDSKTPLIILSITVVLNIGITPLLIIGVGPIPSLGIAGSAVGTILSALISISIGYFCFIKKNIFLNIANWRFRILWHIIKKIFSVGIPASAQMMVKSISWIAIIALINKFGPELTAAYGIGVRIDMFAFLPALSIGIAVSSMAAQNIGVGKFERVSRILKFSILFSLFFSIFFYVIVNFFPQQIASIFTNNKEVIEYTEGYLHIVSFAYLLFAFIFSSQGIIRGAGDTNYLLAFTVVSMLLVRIPLVYLFAQHTSLNEIGIWLGIISSAFIGVILNFIYYGLGKWRKSPSV